MKNRKRINFTVMYEDHPVTEISLSEDKKDISIKKIIPDSVFQPFSGNRQDIFRIYDFLKSRCYEDERADLKDILKKAKLKHNNPWEWVKLTHGVTYEDKFWIKFPGEKLKWRDLDPYEKDRKLHVKS